MEKYQKNPLIDMFGEKKFQEVEIKDLENGGEKFKVKNYPFLNPLRKVDEDFKVEDK